VSGALFFLGLGRRNILRLLVPGREIGFLGGKGILGSLGHLEDFNGGAFSILNPLHPQTKPPQVWCRGARHRLLDPLTCPGASGPSPKICIVKRVCGSGFSFASLLLLV